MKESEIKTIYNIETSQIIELLYNKIILKFIYDDNKGMLEGISIPFGLLEKILINNDFELTSFKLNDESIIDFEGRTRESALCDYEANFKYNGLLRKLVEYQDLSIMVYRNLYESTSDLEKIIF